MRNHTLREWAIVTPTNLHSLYPTRERATFSKSEEPSDLFMREALSAGSYDIELTDRRGTFSELFTLDDENGTRYAVKVPVSDSGERALRSEKDALVHLHEQGVCGVPKPIAWGRARFYDSSEAVIPKGGPALVEELFDFDKFVSIKTLLDDSRFGEATERFRRKDGSVMGFSERVAVLGLDIMKIIKASHDCGIVHRDLSDSNILFDKGVTDASQLSIRVIDFGQAEYRRSALTDQQVITTEARGTSIFESPEMHGYPDVVHLRKERWTDLFSLGALLWYMRVGIEFGPQKAYERFLLSSRNGQRVALYDLMSDLKVLAEENEAPFAAIQADLRLAGLIQRLTNYQPKHRGSDDNAIAQLRDVVTVTGDYDPSLPLSVEQLLDIAIGFDASFAVLAQRAPSSPVIPREGTNSPDLEIPWRLYSLNPEQYGEILYPYCQIGNRLYDVRPKKPFKKREAGMLVLGTDSVLDLFAVDNGLGSPVSSGRWDYQSDTEGPWRKYSNLVEAVIAPYFERGGDHLVQAMLRPTTMAGWFSGLHCLKSVNLSGIDTVYVTDMSHLFSGCSSLVAVALPDSWNLSCVQSMEHMFANCPNLEVVSWFYDAFGPICQNNNTRPKEKEVYYLPRERMAGMKFEGEENEDWWNYWHGGRALLNTVNVESFASMFDGCRKLGMESLMLVCRIRTDRARRLDGFFKSCGAIRGLDLTAMSTGQCTDMSSMFEGCTSLNHLLQDFDLANVRWTDSMFRNANRISHVVFKGESDRPSREVSLRGADGSASIEIHAGSMFSGCDRLEKVELGLFKEHPIADCRHMFRGCSSLTHLDLRGLKTLAVQDMGGMFLDDHSLISIQGLSELDTESVSSLESTFKGCTSLKSLDLHNWNTGNLRNIAQMCFGCKSLEEIDLSGWDLSSVIQASHAFDMCAEDLTILGIERLRAPRLKHPSQYEALVPRAWLRHWENEERRASKGLNYEL